MSLARYIVINDCDILSCANRIDKCRGRIFKQIHDFTVRGFKISRIEDSPVGGIDPKR